MRAIQIVQATPEDAPVLAEMNRLLIQDEGHRNPMTLPELESRMRAWLVGEYEAVLFEHESHPVAYALYRQDQDSIYLRQLFVEREQRRRGIGRQAMSLLFAEVWPAGTRISVEVLVKNRGAHNFWRAMGFGDYAVTLEKIPDGTA